MTISLLNRFLLSLCVWREARGESSRGKELIVHVVLNRLQDSRWPNTIRDVILQPKQFSAFNAGDPNAVLFPRDDDASWQDSLAAVNAVLSGVSPASTANHYHTTGVSPVWRDDTKVVAREQHHIFYSL